MIELLHIFLNSGKTFTFRNIKLVTDNESVLVFEYSAISDGKTKQAIFAKNGIAGWSRTI